MSHLPGYWGASGDTTGGAPAPSGRASGMLLSPHSGQDAPHVRTAGDCANCRRTASLPSTPKSPSASPRQEDNLLHSQDLYEPNHQDPFHKRTLTRSPLLQGQASGLPRLASRGPLVWSRPHHTPPEDKKTPASRRGTGGPCPPPRDRPLRGSRRTCHPRCIRGLELQRASPWQGASHRQQDRRGL